MQNNTNSGDATSTAASLVVNGNQVNVEAPHDTPLLWVLRDELGLTGTKFACGMALCGACTIHINGQATRACVTPLADAINKEVTTIEGVSIDGLHPVQQAWVELQVPQCGFCQSGQIMSAIALLNDNADPTDKDIDQAMSGNLCRCGTYQRIRAAIKTAARNKQQ